MYGRKYDNNVQAQTIRKQIKGKYDDGEINVDNFTQFVRTHPAILFPAFELQTNIQKHILGGEFWRAQAETRLHLSNGEYVSINQILKAHINDAAFNELVMTNSVVNARASKQDSMVKEQIKGALKTSGLSGERKFKSNALKMVQVNSLRAMAQAGVDSPTSSAGSVTPKRKTTLKGAAGAVVAAQRLSR